MGILLASDWEEARPRKQAGSMVSQVGGVCVEVAPDSTGAVLVIETTLRKVGQAVLEHARGPEN